MFTITRLPFVFSFNTCDVCSIQQKSVPLAAIPEYTKE
jgi:hypothetical protein